MLWSVTVGYRYLSDDPENGFISNTCCDHVNTHCSAQINNFSYRMNCYGISYVWWKRSIDHSIFFFYSSDSDFLIYVGILWKAFRKLYKNVIWTNEKQCAFFHLIKILSTEKAMTFRRNAHSNFIRYFMN